MCIVTKDLVFAIFFMAVVISGCGGEESYSGSSTEDAGQDTFSVSSEYRLLRNGAEDRCVGSSSDFCNRVHELIGLLDSGEIDEQEFVNRIILLNEDNGFSSTNVNSPSEPSPGTNSSPLGGVNIDIVPGAVDYDEWDGNRCLFLAPGDPDPEDSGPSGIESLCYEIYLDRYLSDSNTVIRLVRIHPEIDYLDMPKLEPLISRLWDGHPEDANTKSLNFYYRNGEFIRQAPMEMIYRDTGSEMPIRFSGEIFTEEAVSSSHVDGIYGLGRYEFLGEYNEETGMTNVIECNRLAGKECRLPE